MNQSRENLSDSQSNNLENFKNALLQFHTFEGHANQSENGAQIRKTFLNFASNSALTKNDPAIGYWLCYQALVGNYNPFPVPEMPITKIIAVLEEGMRKRHIPSAHLLGKIYLGYYDTVPSELQDQKRGRKLVRQAAGRGFGPAFMTLVDTYDQDVEHFYRRMLILHLTGKFCRLNYAGAYYHLAQKLLNKPALTGAEKKRLMSLLKRASSLAKDLLPEDEDLAGDIRFDYGVCLHDGLGGPFRREEALELITLSMKTCDRAKAWWQEHRTDYAEPEETEVSGNATTPTASVVTETVADKTGDEDSSDDNQADNDWSYAIKLNNPLFPEGTITGHDQQSASAPDLSQEKIEALLEPLDKMAGLGSIKREIRQLLGLARVQEQRRKAGLKVDPLSLHMVFSGNPGTGKTSVARILGDVLKGLGLLSQGHVVEVGRDDLVGKYIGHTEAQTRKIVARAQGGILFIDEAYTLTDDDYESDFGKIALDVITKAMEDKRENFIVIAAGYRDEMRNFLRTAPGLASRFSSTIDFPDYTAEDMATIFETMCGDKDYLLTDDARAVLGVGLKKMKDSATKNYDKTFGNARAVRQLFEKTLLRQAERLSRLCEPSKDDLMRLDSRDLTFTEPVGDGKVTYLH